MKKIIALSFLFLCVFSAIAQSPQAIPYQAVLRNSDGSVMANQAVTITFTIHNNAVDGTTEYQENHSTTSNDLGLINLNIGQGTPSVGTFSAINWGSGTKFLQVAMNSGNGNIDLGTQQMLSVPYALFANNTTVFVSSTGDTLTIGNQRAIIPGISAANISTNILGCTDIAACNYNNSATQNDNSCLFLNSSCDDGNVNTANDMINGNCQCVGTTLTIGQDYQGGKVAYIFEPGDAGYVAGETHGLIAVAQDLGSYSWGCITTNVSGADAQAIGTGAQNTLDIVNSGCGIAAQACADLVLNGYNDWFLPSLIELTKLRENYNLIGGFQNMWYWSSTEYNSEYAGRFYFDIIVGNPAGNNLKGNNSRVRPVRYF